MSLLWILQTIFITSVKGIVKMLNFIELTGSALLKVIDHHPGLVLFVAFFLAGCADSILDLVI